MSPAEASGDEEERFLVPISALGHRFSSTVPEGSGRGDGWAVCSADGWTISETLVRSASFRTLWGVGLVVIAPDG